jgi:predicted ATPase
MAWKRPFSQYACRFQQRLHYVQLHRLSFSQKINVTPMDKYSELVSSGAISEDPSQMALMMKLEYLYNDLLTYTPEPEKEPEEARFLLSSFLKVLKKDQPTPVPSDPKVRGLYIYGPPGCGKTFLMDIFFSVCPMKKKIRAHHAKFMLDLHAKMHEFKKSKAGMAGKVFIRNLALDISERANLLCFDEFQVTDIADAVLVNQVFSELFKLGIVVVATSNREPDALYLGGLQRHQVFAPFIPVLKRHCSVFDMASVVDYRTLGLMDLTNRPYLQPINEKNRMLFETAFLATCGKDVEPRPITLNVMLGRVIEVPRGIKGEVTIVDFATLCVEARGSADYVALAGAFKQIFISDVPQMTLLERNELRRFILLIDELYQAHVQVKILAEVPAEKLFRNDSNNQVFDEVFAWERCLSRLIEMQTEEYRDAKLVEDSTTVNEVVPG